MKPLPNIPWPRIFAEGAIIVVSILLAFAIDAWWDERKTRQEEAEYLATLHTAIINQQAKIDRGLEFANSLRDTTRRILEAAVDPDVSITDAELDIELENLTWAPQSPVMPELEWLLSENRVGLVSDTALLNELGRLRLNLLEIDLTHQSARNLFRNHIQPYLTKHASLPQLNNIVSPEPGTSDMWPAYKMNLASTESHLPLLEKREFVNLLVDYEWRLTSIIDWRTSAVEADDETGVEGVLRLLEE